MPPVPHYEPESERERYVDIATFAAIGEPAEWVEGKDWRAAFTQEELDQHDAELLSVVAAQQYAAAPVHREEGKRG